MNILNQTAQLRTALSNLLLALRKTSEVPASLDAADRNAAMLKTARLDAQTTLYETECLPQPIAKVAYKEGHYDKPIAEILPSALKVVKPGMILYGEMTVQQEPQDTGFSVPDQAGLAQAVMNTMVANGSLNEILDQVISSKEPDGTFCVLGTFLSKVVNTTLRMAVNHYPVMTEIEIGRNIRGQLAPIDSQHPAFNRNTWEPLGTMQLRVPNIEPVLRPGHSPGCDVLKPMTVNLNGTEMAIFRNCDCGFKDEVLASNNN